MRHESLSVLCFMAFIFVTTSSYDLNWWCDQTPHPVPCKYHHNRRHPSTTSSSSISRNKFLNGAIQVATVEALNALKQIRLLEAGGGVGQGNADCARFYEDTVFQLNRTQMSTAVPPSVLDIQTWLSAALTNVRFCENRFSGCVSTNISQLISNALAINILGMSDSTARTDNELTRSSATNEQFLQSPDAVVAKDGSGNFTTIKEALDASLRPRQRTRFMIYVKQGVYNEYLEITGLMTNIIMVGDGMHRTLITGNRSTTTGYSTYDSATVKLIADGFVAKGITFENTAGPASGQAVAVYSQSDCSAFYHCGFHSYQDTLCVWSQRQFFRDCTISGTIDFIWGNAAVVFQNCNIAAMRPPQGAAPVITAQGRTNPNESTGFSIQGSKIMPGPDLAPPILERYNITTYLGRPYQPYSRTVYLECFMDGLVDPAGWLDWDGAPVPSTLFYGEYGNSGPGAETSHRVKWEGYKVITDEETAAKFTVAELIGGQSWLPTTNVPFSSGL